MKYILALIVVFFWSITNLLAQLPALFNTTNPSLVDTKKNQNKNGHIISVQSFAPMLSHFTIGHETGLGHDYSIETKISIIHKQPKRNETTIKDPLLQEGFFIRSGLKFYRQRDFINPNLQRYHRFQGRYFKPEIIVGFIKSTDVVNSSNTKNISFGALMFNFGRQYVFVERFVIGYEVGVGYAFSNEGKLPSTRANSRPKFYYSHIGTPNASLPIAISASFNVGIVIGK
ncbi:MAG: hypothetical protein EAZ85_11555 [Bacteroidetes bacterium]|nr:MAG: hypothetical protein EAZ85_11555 [Bacteroidota bacterium]